LLESANDPNNPVSQNAGDEPIGDLQTIPASKVSGYAVGGSEMHQRVDTAAQEVEYLSVAAMSGPDGQTLPMHDDPSFATLVTEAVKLAGEPEVNVGQALNGQPLRLLSLQEELVALCQCDLRSFIDQYCAGVGHVYPCISSNS
jgi:hypothetical protein